MIPLQITGGAGQIPTDATTMSGGGSHAYKKFDLLAKKVRLKRWISGTHR